MPLRSVIDIDVNDDAFRQFHALYEKYASSLDKMPQAWSKINTAQQQTRSSFVEMAAVLLAQNELLHKSSREMDEIDRSVTRTHRSMQSLSRVTRDFYGNLSQATSTLMKWTGLTGVIGTLTGLLSVEGISHLASSAAYTYRTTLGYAGTTPGQVGAAGAYSGILDPQLVLSRLTDMMTSAEGYRGLNFLGFSPQDAEKGAGPLMPEFLRRLQARAKATPLMNLTDVMSGGGLGAFNQEARILRNMSPEQLAEFERMRIRAERELADVSERMLQKWTLLSGQIDLAGVKIKTAFIEGLEPLVPQFNRITEAFSNGIIQFGKSKEVNEWLTKLAGTLEQLEMEKFVSGIKEGATKLVSLASALTDLITKITGIVTWLNDHTNNFGGAQNNSSTSGWLGWLFSGTFGFSSDRVPLPPGVKTPPLNSRSNIPWYGRTYEWLTNRPWGSSNSMLDRQWYTGEAPASQAEHGGFNFAGIRASTQGMFRTYPGEYEGVADTARLLQVYQQRHGVNTLEGIINRWAPPNENNTDELIQRAERWTGFTRKQTLDLNDPAVMYHVLGAMNRNEFGGNRTVTSENLREHVKRYFSENGVGGNSLSSIASQWLGTPASDPKLRSYVKDASNLDPTTAAWCAAFANAVLAQKGIKGSGSNLATSFINWGKGVDAGDVHPDDIMVLPRGHEAGEKGGHVGIATGRRRGSKLEMISGNLRGGVNTSWEDATEVVVRRAPGLRVTVEHETGASAPSAAAQVAR